MSRDLGKELQEAKENPPDVSALEELSVEKITTQLKQTEDELGLEYVGPDKGSNRAQRREMNRTLKRVTRRPEATLTLRHPILDTVTPYGAKKLKKRRAAAKRAKQARKVNR